MQSPDPSTLEELPPEGVVLPLPMGIPRPRNPNSIARLSAVHTVYHQKPPNQPVSMVVRYSRPLATEEQPYFRTCKIGPVWKPLETGWLKAASLVSISNEEGRFRQRIPTQEELEDTEKRIIEIGYLDPTTVSREIRTQWDSPTQPTIIVPRHVIRPTEEFSAEPYDLSTVWIRCRHGEAECNISIFPA